MTVMSSTHYPSIVYMQGLSLAAIGQEAEYTLGRSPVHPRMTTRKTELKTKSLETTQPKKTNTWGEHTNFMQKPGSEPSFCKKTVKTTTRPSYSS